MNYEGNYSSVKCVSSLLTQIMAFKYWKPVFSTFCAIHNVIAIDKVQF